MARACANLLIFGLLVGCSAHKPIHIDTRVNYRVRIDPKHCRTNLDGTIDCDHGCKLSPDEIRVK